MNNMIAPVAAKAGFRNAAAEKNSGFVNLFNLASTLLASTRDDGIVRAASSAVFVTIMLTVTVFCGVAGRGNCPAGVF